MSRCEHKVYVEPNGWPCGECETADYWTALDEEAEARVVAEYEARP